jgi:hypothetical protein
MRASYAIYQRFFFLLVLLSITGCGTPVYVSGLKPQYPKFVTGHGGIGYYEVVSLRPFFRWESFPRSQDLKRDKDGLLSRIDKVTYDLKIWRAQDDYDYPAELVYSRQQIPVSAHVMKESLEPSTKYFWTVRARFEIDGQTRVTEWGVGWHGRRLPVIPNLLYYRFKTPPE